MARLIDMDNCANLDQTNDTAKEEDIDDKPLRYRTVSSIIRSSPLLLADSLCRVPQSSFLDLSLLGKS